MSKKYSGGVSEFTTKELKHCPFCGSKANAPQTAFYWNAGYKVVCNDCGMETPYSRSVNDVVNMWNKRV